MHRIHTLLCTIALAAALNASDGTPTYLDAVWGVFIWKEFQGGSRVVNLLLGLMFLLFIAGLSLIVVSGGN